MPIYTYQVVEPDGSDGEIFEVEQSIDSPALTHHPENGKKIRRIYSRVNINSEYTKGREDKLSNIDYIKKKGFEVLQKDKISGNYYKL